MSFLEYNGTCVISEEYVICNNTRYILPEKRLTYKDDMFWVYISVYVGLVLIAGLMSGLTMGLLSLDTTSLMVLRESGTPSQQRQAKKILPLIRRHHLLLVTLLLANAAAVESMPLFLDRVSDPVTAIVVSVSAVLLFGEVLPQALCTRYGLAIGSSLTWLVYFLIALLFIIAWPLSKLLDCLLGEEHGTFFRRAELKALVGLHGPKKDEEDGSHDSGQVPTEQLTSDEVSIIKGALDMRFKSVGDAMLPLENVYMVSIDEKFDHKKMDEVIDKSHSRIPVYEGSQSNIIGILLVKRLIKLNPADGTPVSEIVKNSKCFREVPFISDSMPLFDVLNEFQTGKCHLSVVMKEPCPSTDFTPDGIKKGEVVGIISLEDVIEELLQEEIIDETDVYIDIARKVFVAHAIGGKKAAYHRSISATAGSDEKQKSRNSYGAINSDPRSPLLEGDELSIESSDPP